MVVAGMKNIDLDFIRQRAREIVTGSPVRYIQYGALHGSLFNAMVNDTTVSSIDTSFFIDLTEPLKTLEIVQRRNGWPLGELLEGHEFLLVIENALSETSKPHVAGRDEGPERAMVQWKAITLRKDVNARCASNGFPL